MRAWLALSAGRRARVYAYTLVTTALVIVFTFAEWEAARLVMQRSRAAGITVEIAVVLAAALVFRPFQTWTERAVEAQIYKRKREALAALARFRRELSSFNEIHQLLRRVVEAVEHYLEAAGCAIYLRREAYRAEASSFDVVAGDVDPADPLLVHLRSSGTPARQALLKSTVPGTHAFPMAAAGDLIGFLCVHCKHGEYDAEELQMLTGLAQDLAVVLTALDPLLRPRKEEIANNLPRVVRSLIGREREVVEVNAALEQSRVVTIVGPGGVGKTSVALRCAKAAVQKHEHGAWFIDLAPVTDPTVVTTTILAALGTTVSSGEPLQTLLDYLRARDLLLLLDNCEQVVAEVATIASQIRAWCPRVTTLATSRELLHIEGEQVYKVASLRPEASFELFAQRAIAIVPDFDAQAHAAAVRSICERLDGIPLAIELAAARVRVMSPSEILGHLNERFALLTDTTRTASPRHQTMAATIQWSYDLLSAQEQSLFSRLSTFRGSFTLPAAAALCAQDGQCDEFHILDVLTSLADKSLVNVTIGAVTRYRFLETIRQFAAQGVVETHARAIAANQHAAYFAAVAAQAYYEFDSSLTPGWLERLAPDIDNFRAALEWALNGEGGRRIGAQLAADCGPIFLRLYLLREGLAWCERARRVDRLPPGTAGRIEYIASMMHHNSGDGRLSVQCAESAVSFYRNSEDERGLSRALSQVAHLYARAGRFDDAKALADEAVALARRLHEPRVLIGVLRRCAWSLPPSDVESARQRFSEALETAQAIHDPEEACIVLGWWAEREARNGSFERAVDLAIQALPYADRGRRMDLEVHIAQWAIVSGNVSAAEPHALRGLELAVEFQHPHLRALGILYCSPFFAAYDAPAATMLLGYATESLNRLRYEWEPEDQLAMQMLRRSVEAHLKRSEAEFSALLEQGAAWTDEEARAAFAPQLSTLSERSLAGVDRHS